MSKANVPSVPAGRNISDTVLKESCKTVEQSLARIDSLEKKMPGERSGRWGADDYFHYYNDPLHFDYAGARQTLMQERQACKFLPQVTRKAGADEIATQLALLYACYPHQEKGERRIFERLLCEDVADLEPSVYALHLACRRLRQRSKFLPAIAEVVDELKACIKRANRLDNLQARLSDMQKELDSYEQDVPRLKQKREEEEKLTGQRVQERAKDFPPEIFTGCYRDDELKLLGLTREELSNRRAALRAQGLLPPSGEG